MIVKAKKAPGTINDDVVNDGMATISEKAVIASPKIVIKTLM